MRATAPLTGFAIASLMLLASCGDREDSPPANDPATTAPDAAALAARSDGQWLTLTGTIVSAAPNSFVLDYGAGNVAVEMDDWDPFPEGLLLKAGDQVTVSGLADQDLFLKKRIEARSVYVRNLNTYFFASNADEEELRSSARVATNVTTLADFTGRVSAIEGREFTLGTGPAAIRVDTSLMADNPLDAVGLQQIRVGDRVFAWGEVDFDAAEGAELKAKGLISLVRSGAGRAIAPSAASPPPASAAASRNSADSATGNATGPAASNATNSTAT